MYKSINCYKDKVIFVGNYCPSVVDDVLMRQVSYHGRRQALLSGLGKILRYSLTADPFASMTTGSVINFCMLHMTDIKKHKTIQ